MSGWAYVATHRPYLNGKKVAFTIAPLDRAIELLSGGIEAAARAAIAVGAFADFTTYAPSRLAWNWRHGWPLVDRADLELRLELNDTAVDRSATSGRF